MATTVVIGKEFVYGSDTSTLGSRWTTWVKKFDIYVTANSMKEKEVVKASFLHLMGGECFAIYEANCQETDDLDSIKADMNRVLVASKSEFTEICKFRRAAKMKDETVNEYATRLRALAAHCNFKTTLDTEILRHFVVSCGMIQVERECTRKDGWNLADMLVMANGYERSANNLKDLRGPVDHSTINYTNAKENEKLKDWRKPAGSGSSYGRSSGGGSSYRSSGDISRQNNSGSIGAGRCDRCGRYAHKNGEKCYAVDQQCRKCDKTGHYEKLKQKAATVEQTRTDLSNGK